MAEDRSIVAAQMEVLRRATDTAHGGTSRKVLASALGVCESGLRNYIDGTNVMGLGVFARLVAFDPDLASLLLPDGFAAVRLPAGMDHAQAAMAAADFLASYAGARHPASEAGEAIGPGEAAVLTTKVSAIGGGTGKAN